MKMKIVASKAVKLTMGILFGIAVIIFFSNALISRQWINNPEPPGKEVFVDGRRVYVTDMGSGSPAVIILHDILSFSPEWRTVQNKLAEYIRVISYDRAGYGWSQYSSEPRTSLTIITELDELLHTLEVSGPCILVGHGIGGLYAQHFAFLHPERIGAIVLVDPITVSYTRFKEEVQNAVYQNLINRTSYLEVLCLFSFSGLIRSLNIVPSSIEQESLQHLLKNHYSLYPSYAAMRNEYALNLDTSITQVRRDRRSLAAPIVVILPSPEKAAKGYSSFGLSFDDGINIERIRKSLAEESASFSKSGRIVISGKGGHNLHIDDGSLIVNTVRAVILNNIFCGNGNRASDKGL